LFGFGNRLRDRLGRSLGSLGPTWNILLLVIIIHR